jgi:hypothetical protein
VAAHGDEVDLRPVKALAAKILPYDDPQRVSLAGLPDWLPRDEALVVIRFYVRYFATRFGRICAYAQPARVVPPFLPATM